MNFGFYQVPPSDSFPKDDPAKDFIEQQNMLPTPPSNTSSSNGQFSPDGQFKVVRKRNRVPLSCAPCRNRKLKCNRSQPCENCVKRGDSLSCSYAALGTRKKQSQSLQGSHSPDDMQNRIDRLEGLVLSLMTNGSQSVGPSAAARALSMHSSPGSMKYPQDVDVDVEGEDCGGRTGEESETDQVVQSLGVMRVDNNKSLYYGDAHWAAILSDISEVKQYFKEHKQQWEEQMVKVQRTKINTDATPQGPMFLFGGTQPPEYAELLAQVPKRTLTDKLVARYFNSYDPAVHILHPPSWYRTYERHWQNPDKTGPAWLGQIFAILCLAMNSYYQMDDEPSEFRGKSLALSANYRRLTGQCLLLADFTRPVNYMMETLVLHLHCEYARNRDAEIGVWVLVGMIVRLAMRMGYHRDPKYYLNITAFQGEMRRRVWTFVRQSDLLFSFQIGLPSMIRLGDCDAELPSNLYDDEFDEDTKVLPLSRPASEPTPVSYMCAKATIAFAFGKVVERLHTVASCSYDDIMALDTDLREARAEIPPHLRMRTIEESMMDPGALVMQRFNLSIVYHKGQCVLHRKFLAKARENTRYAHSRRTCVDSSMDLLSIQATLHQESCPGHRLHGMKIFTSSLTAADFLLAAMIVALDLSYASTAEAGGQGSGDLFTWGSERRGDMIRAIEISNGIWKETRDQSMEAFKASEILTVMLKKLQMNRAPPGCPAQGIFPFPGMTNGADATQAYGAPVEEKPEHSAAMTLGMLSNGGMTPNSAAMFNGAFPFTNTGETQGSGLTPGFPAEQSANGIPSAPSPLSFFGNGNSGQDPSANLDWDAWDNYIQNASLEPNSQVWPTSVDPALTAPAADGPQQQQVPQQPPADGFNRNNGVFMGVSSPANNLPL